MPDWAIGLIIFGPMLPTWIIGIKVLLSICAEGNVQSGLVRDTDGSTLQDGDFAFAAFLGFMAAIFWPLGWLIGLVYAGYLMIGGIPRFFMPRVEREHLERQELKRLRKQVEEMKIKGGELL